MVDTLSNSLLDWFDLHGRKDLPWQHPRSPYAVWVSEVMLQQTQVGTVIPYFGNFMRRFPDVRLLAAAHVDEVLHLWSGLGYYSRGRNLHAAAIQIVERFNAEMPDTVDALQSLPGIGRSTAGAIVAMGFGQRAPILDGNVKRVLARYHCIDGYPGNPPVTRRLWALADQNTPHVRVADYTQAIMDLGATVCTRRNPVCGQCPLRQKCRALREGKVDGLPERKPRKTLPVTDRHFWLIQDAEGACLLERRPTTGLWGGLWSPPERTTDFGVERLGSELGLELAIETALAIGHTRSPAPFQHTFTHLQMNVLPIRARVLAATKVADRDDLLWYRPGFNQNIGLSAVGSRLLNELYRSDG
jgi:A/G-specific adenine glycosylase